jgi:hypothetical protein
MIEFAPAWQTCWYIKSVRDNGTMGWRYKDSKRWASPTAPLLDDSEEVPLIALADDDCIHYMPVGNADAWLRACKL